MSGNFGAEVPHADVTSLTDAALKRILLCLYGQRFVVLRTSGLTKAQFVKFARRVGDPIRLSGDPDFPEIANITKYRIHDLILWDNPTTMHCATPMAAATGPEDTRLMHRISLRGTPSVFSRTQTAA